MRIPDNAAIVVGGLAVIVVGVIFFLKTTTGKAVGENVAGVVTGAIGGVAGAVGTVANDESVNPLYGIGSWAGEKIFNIFN